MRDRWRWVSLLMAVAIVFTGCRGKRLTRSERGPGLGRHDRKQVESILGPPTSVDSTNLLVTKKVTYVYQQGDGSVTVVFLTTSLVEGEQPSRVAVICEAT